MSSTRLPSSRAHRISAPPTDSSLGWSGRPLSVFSSSTAADREVGIAKLRRDRPRHLAGLLEARGHLVRHLPQLIMQPLAVDEVALERVLDADRDPLRLELEPARIDAACPIAEDCADAAG